MKNIENSLFPSYSDGQRMILNKIAASGKCTRSSLVESSSFKLLTVTKAVSRFIEDGVVEEAEYEQSTGGRRAGLLSINGHFRYVLAADIGGSCARIGVVGLNGEIMEYEIVEAEGNRIPARHVTVEELRERFQTLMDKYGHEKILGIGLGISGVVQHEQNRILFCPNIFGWNNVDLTQEFEKPLGVPVFVDTAARCMALAEYRMGAGKGVANQVSVSVGSSVAAGIIINGELFRGATGSAGEIGHITIRNNSTKRCTCGNTGCLEMFVTYPPLRSGAIHEAEKFNGFSPLKMMLEEKGSANITPEDIRLALEQGDNIAQDAVNECAEMLGMVISYLVNIVNPSVIVLGGATIVNFPQLVGEIQKIAKRHSLAAGKNSLLVCSSKLGVTSAMLGAALQVTTQFI